LQVADAFGNDVMVCQRNLPNAEVGGCGSDQRLVFGGSFLVLTRKLKECGGFASRADEADDG
jgi:hypothetical protein